MAESICIQSEPSSVDHSATLIELLRRRALEQSERLAYTFLRDGEVEEVSLTYAELDQRARSIAMFLKETGACGERILLLYPPGLEYVAAFFGCLYAGAVAVPAYPPRLNRRLVRLRSIVVDAQVAFALTTPRLLSRIAPLVSQVEDLQNLKWLTSEMVDERAADHWQEPAAGGETLALLQYTSGSTGQPKGVMLTHRNLLHNSALLQRAFEYTSESVCVSWLPVYHDMGLIGGVLQPLHGGFPCVLMSPMSFLQRPFRWLNAISRYGATISGGPNFAYELCVRKTSVEERAALDLSNWSVAFNGSEPIRMGTLSRFAAAFEPCGFRRRAFFPCYGLAEATLFVSGSSKSVPPVTLSIESKAFENNRVNAVQESAGLTLVSSGRILPEQKIVIVDPVSRLKCAPDQVGEIWLSSPSVAQGYWNRPEETEENFHAFLAGTGEGPFLRTGDLGFLRDDQLFVTGRLKDLIIIRGVNLYPQDVELAVESSHPALRPGCSAAFAIDMDGQERLVVVQEVAHHVESNLLIETIRQNVSEEFEVQVHALVLVKPGGIPKTSSGKIQRQACRTEYIEGKLPVMAEWRAGETPESAPPAYSAAPPLQSTKAITDWLVAQLSTRLSVDASLIDADQTITRYGIDSLEATELMHNIETSLGVNLPAAVFFQGPSIAQLAGRISEELTAASSAARTLPSAVRTDGSEHPLSHGQQAMWFLYQLAPESAAYNIAAAMRIRGEVHAAALHSSFQKLIDRHEALRTTFSATQTGPVQRVHEQVAVYFQRIDAIAWSETEVNDYLVQEAHRPFDLEQGPLLRIYLLTRSAREHVALLTVHHIVADFWSLAVLINELGVVYEAETRSEQVTLPPIALQYSDYVRWQRQMLAGPEGDALWAYWQKKLEGERPSLNLPTDTPRPPVQTYRGASQTFRLSVELTRKLRSLAKAKDATLYATLLAAFQVMLHRYTGERDIFVGSLAAGRSSAPLAGVVGYFTNPIVLRAEVSGDLTFDAFLDQVRRTMSAAFEHQNYPFPLLVERLQPERDPSRSPLFQVMFALQKAPLLNNEGLAALALGEAGGRIKLGELALESMALDQRVAQFDLTLLMAEVDGELAGSLQYNTDLFEARTIARMGSHFQCLLHGIVANPQQRIADLPVLTTAEQKQLVSEWNDTRSDSPLDSCIHHLFEAQAAATPGAIAAVCDGEKLTYHELNRRANKLAHHLNVLGVGPEMLVGVCLERSLDMIVSLLAILKAGAAYVPLDPSYPKQRLAYILEDAKVAVLLTQLRLFDRLPPADAQMLCLDTPEKKLSQPGDDNPVSDVNADNLAYVIYTSGSTARPKGVMVTHRSVVNFFDGMDQRVGCDASDTLLAVTSISFDISVLELLWTLSRGARVVLIPEYSPTAAIERKSRARAKEMRFSLFYFASNDNDAVQEGYRLLMEGARYADRHGFVAVWTPERHFHAFGGLYPNPSVMSAALATITKKIQIRAGSVVMPLHHAVRVAEEWSLVDNLSRGRVGIAFASGWHADDFIFFPENYADRKKIMFDGIETVQKLWRGESVKVRGGAGNEIEVKIFPQPIQPQLPVWITAAGSAETFIKAGEMGANVLTHLLGQSLEEVAEKIKLYREARSRHGHDPQAGQVTLMLHTFIGEDGEMVRDKVRVPFTNYLRSSVGLISNLVRSLNLSLNLQTMSTEDMESLLAFAFDRYFESSALFGTPTSCLEMIERLQDIGVDETACLVDFGVDTESALAGLDRLNALRELSNNHHGVNEDYSLAAQAVKYQPTLMQCTPSLMRMLMLDPEAVHSLRSLRTLLLGGEALPSSLAGEVKETLPGKLINMYGPTETTIWSATHEVEEVGTAIPIGRPIVNTQCYVLDQYFQPAPAGVVGELYVGGLGLARGYFEHPELTAEKFLPDPFTDTPGTRLYRTGDRARYLSDGQLEFLGRADFQVKVRGHRIELEEIEAVLGEHPAVRETVVSVQETAPADSRVVAYVVAQLGDAFSSSELRDFLKERVPEFMIPSTFVTLEALPLTANGKIDRKALAALGLSRSEPADNYVAPRSHLEQSIAALWQQALGIEKAGIHDNFFDLGGHSLLMAQVHRQLEELVGKNLPLIKLLEHPTISSLAKYLAQEQTQDTSFDQTRERAMKQRAGFKRRKASVAQTSH